MDCVHSIIVKGPIMLVFLFEIPVKGIFKALLSVLLVECYIYDEEHNLLLCSTIYRISVVSTCQKSIFSYRIFYNKLV